MMRVSGRSAALAVVAVLTMGSFAQAAIIASSTLVREPPTTNFTAPDTLLPAPWVGYRLSLTATDGDLIQAVEATISGQLHQRWTASGFDGVYDTPTGNSPTNTTNGDSHFLASTAAPPSGLGMLFAAGPNEDNPATGSPLSVNNDDTTGWGVGTTMSATFGPPGAGLTSMNVAYIVVPKGSEPNLNIHVNVFDPQGNPPIQLDSEDFGFIVVPPQNEPPIVGDLGPLVGDMSANGPHIATPVSGTLPASDDGGVANLTWMFTGVDSFTPDPDRPGPANIVSAPTLDPATGLFSWDVDGSKGGLYTFGIKATDAGPGTPLSDDGVLSVRVIVPEPASLSLIGLALVGLVGFARRRG